jgi:hypothetical protein
VSSCDHLKWFLSTSNSDLTHTIGHLFHTYLWWFSFINHEYSIQKLQKKIKQYLFLHFKNTFNSTQATRDFNIFSTQATRPNWRMPWYFKKPIVKIDSFKLFMFYVFFFFFFFCKYNFQTSMKQVLYMSYPLLFFIIIVTYNFLPFIFHAFYI